MYDVIYGQNIQSCIQEMIRSRQFGQRILGNSLSNEQQIIQALLDSKERLFFAEQGQIGGWTFQEQRILGGINIAMKVHIFDDGTWSFPNIHRYPFEGTLLFCPGPLLSRTDCWDHKFIVQDGKIDPEKYALVLEERIVPLLLYVQETAIEPSLVCLPGLGCGVFAGVFKGMISHLFIRTVRNILEKYSSRLSKIAMVYHYAYGPYESELRYEEQISETMRFVQWRNGPSMLSRPSVIDADFHDGTPLFKFVAWDHFSWPGNDFFANSRQTDDGVSAAATSSMASLLEQPIGMIFRYERSKNKFLAFEGDRERSWMNISPNQRLVPEQMLCLT